MQSILFNEFVCSHPTGKSIVAKKGDGSQVKESTDSNTTIEDDDVKGKSYGDCNFLIDYTNQQSLTKNN